MEDNTLTSILYSIKKLLGIAPSYDAFDNDIILHINSVLMVLNQLGVGPEEGYAITGATESWTDYLGSAFANVELVKSYIYLKVKLMFDPPQSAGAVQAIKEQISEFEWRINVQVDPKEVTQNG